jgi:capsular polysaccharide biosynthesis protein
MYLQQILVSLRRRWLLTCAAILVVASAGYAALSLAGPTYTTESSLVLVPPETTTKTVNPDGTETDGNPYMYLGGLTEARDVLVKAMTSETVHGQVAEQAPTGSYDVTPDFDTPAPMVVITTKSPDPRTAKRLTKAVLDQVPIVLSQIQDDLAIQPGARITTREVTADPVAVSHKAQLRLLVVSVAGSVAILALLIATIDGLLLRRERAAAATTADSDEPWPFPDVAPTTTVVTVDDLRTTSSPAPVDVQDDVEQRDGPDQDDDAARAPTARPTTLGPTGSRERRSRRERRARARTPSAPGEKAGAAARGDAARAAS